MNFSGATLVVLPMATTFTFNDGRDPVEAIHPLMTPGNPIEHDGAQWRVQSINMVGDQYGARQTIALTRLT